MKKMAVRFGSLMLALLLLVSAVPFTTLAAGWPSLSTSAYCEMVSPVQINVYRDEGLTTRGTSSPGRSYNAYVAKNDLIRIYKVTDYYTVLAYPTSSGMRTGMVSTAQLFGRSSPAEVISASAAKVTTYKGPSTALRSGSVAVGDKVYKLGTSGGFILIVYDAASGARRFKAAFVTAADYERIRGGASSDTPSASSRSAAWDFPMKGAYCTWRSATNMSWASYNKNSSGRNYHLGIDIYGSNGTVYAAADGRVVAASSSTSGANGRYIILQHTLSGRTVYSFYAHLGSVSVSVGQNVSRGTKIGVAGGSGYGKNNAYGTHLHFAVVDTLWSNGRYYGYASSFSGNKVRYEGVTYYNPVYLVNNDRLPG